MSASWACRPLAHAPTKSPIKPLTAKHNSSNRNLTVFSFDISSRSVHSANKKNLTWFVNKSISLLNFLTKRFLKTNLVLWGTYPRGLQWRAQEGCLSYMWLVGDSSIHSLRQSFQVQKNSKVAFEYSLHRFPPPRTGHLPDQCLHLIHTIPQQVCKTAWSLLFTSKKIRR